MLNPNTVKIIYKAAENLGLGDKTGFSSEDRQNLIMELKNTQHRYEADLIRTTVNDEEFEDFMVNEIYTGEEDEDGDSDEDEEE